VAKCRECEIGRLRIIGTGFYGDTVEVECQNAQCGEVYEVEPDGLGMCGEEMAFAMLVEERRRAEEQTFGDE